MKMIKIVCIKYCILYTLLLNNKNNKEKYVMHLDDNPYDILYYIHRMKSQMCIIVLIHILVKAMSIKCTIVYFIIWSGRIKWDFINWNNFGLLIRFNMHSPRPSHIWIETGELSSIWINIRRIASKSYNSPIGLSNQ